MSHQDAIETKLNAALQPELLRVVNESSGHNVPRGSETHFRVVVVASRFDGLSRVARHRLVNEALQAELQSGVHALAIEALTPDQWLAQGGSPLGESPACRGGMSREGADGAH